MKTEKDKVRANLVRKLRENTIFQNAYDKLYIVDVDGTERCIGSVVSASNELLDEALKTGGFIC